jgi:hypothetical protein
MRRPSVILLTKATSIFSSERSATRVLWIACRDVVRLPSERRASMSVTTVDRSLIRVPQIHHEPLPDW